jgi:hypothetical protein
MIFDQDPNKNWRINQIYNGVVYFITNTIKPTVKSGVIQNNAKLFVELPGEVNSQSNWNCAREYFGEDFQTFMSGNNLPDTNIQDLWNEWMTYTNMFLTQFGYKVVSNYSSTIIKVDTASRISFCKDSRGFRRCFII